LSSGNLYYFDKMITKKEVMLLRRTIISYMFQNYGLLDNSTVWENIKLATKYNKEFNKNDLFTLLDEMSLPKSVLNEKVYRLSGGEQQRISLIRTLVKPFQILFADEPTGNLDKENTDFIFSYLKNLCLAQNKAIVLVTHEKDYLNYATQAISLE